MSNNSKSVLFLANPSFDLNSLKRMLFTAGELCRSRSSAFSLAKKWRQDFPLAFVRVLKVDDSYFVITDEEQYNDYWEFRKIAMRNERRLKNETL